MTGMTIEAGRQTGYDSGSQACITVKEGDTLVSIIKEAYPDATETEVYNMLSGVASANGIEDPNKISIGQEIYITDDTGETTDLGEIYEDTLTDEQISAALEEEEKGFFGKVIDFITAPFKAIASLFGKDDSDTGITDADTSSTNTTSPIEEIETSVPEVNENITVVMNQETGNISSETEVDPETGEEIKYTKYDKGGEIDYVQEYKPETNTVSTIAYEDGEILIGDTFNLDEIEDYKAYRNTDHSGASIVLELQKEAEANKEFEEWNGGY